VIGILATNVTVLYLCYWHSLLAYHLTTYTHGLKELVSRPFSYAFSRLVRLATPDHLTDSTDTLLALCIVAIVQVFGCIYLRRVLHGCCPLPLPLQQQQQQHVTPQELQELAESMTEPRQVRCIWFGLHACTRSRHVSLQCSVCAYGPADHFGCANLLVHHGEQRSRGAATSNACPSCGFLGRTTHDWEQWLSRTDSAQEFRRIRAWNTAVIIVRASVKSLIVPLFFMRMCAATRCFHCSSRSELPDAACSLSPSLSAAVVITFSCASVKSSACNFSCRRIRLIRSFCSRKCAPVQKHNRYTKASAPPNAC
jgi:hypothetical protein